MMMMKKMVMMMMMAMTMTTTMTTTIAMLMLRRRRRRRKMMMRKTMRTTPLNSSSVFPRFFLPIPEAETGFAQHARPQASRLVQRRSLPIDGCLRAPKRI